MCEKFRNHCCAKVTKSRLLLITKKVHFISVSTQKTVRNCVNKKHRSYAQIENYYLPHNRARPSGVIKRA